MVMHVTIVDTKTTHYKKMKIITELAMDVKELHKEQDKMLFPANQLLPIVLLETNNTNYRTI